MTQPPGGYPPPDPGEQQHPPPADPFYAPPSWDPHPSHSSYPPPPPPQPSSPPPPPPPPPSNPYAAPSSPYPPPGATVPMAGPGSPPPPTTPFGAPPYPPPGPPPRRRRGLVIGAIALAGALVLLVGGGLTAWLLARDPDRNGAESPTLAVESFLQAVYHNQDADQAADLVCSEARDQAALQTKIDELRAYQETQVNPTFEWTDPAVVDETDQLAVVAVTVTLTTGDEKTADQNLQVSVVDKGGNGWWVCDLATVQDASTPPPGDEGATPAPTVSPSETGG